MKKVILLVIVFAALNLHAVRHFAKVYHKDYGSISRLVLVFDSKITPEIVSNPSQKKIEIFIPNTVKSQIVDPKLMFSSKILNSMITEEMSNELAITLNIEKSFTESHFSLGSSPYKLVFDIFTIKNPTTYKQLFDYATFYQTVGAYNKATEYYQKIENSHPEKTGFYYYWSNIDLKRNKKDKAIKKLKMVKNNSVEFQKAFERLNELDPPSKRVVQKKTESKKKIQPQKVVTTSTAKDETIKTEEPAVTTQTNISTDLDLQKQYTNFFENCADKDEKLKLLGLVAHHSGNYSESLKYYLQIENKDELINRELYEIYTALEDNENAQLFKSMLVSDTATKDEKPVSFFMRDIKLWVALVLAGLVAIIVFFLLMLRYNKRKMEILDETFSNEEVTYHSDIIKNSYKNQAKPEVPQQNTAPVVEEVEEESLEFDFEEEEETVTEEEKSEVKENFELDLDSLNLEDNNDFVEDEDIVDEDTNFDDDNEILEEEIDYDNPPLITEEITEEEEQELVEDEEDELNLFDDLTDDEDSFEESDSGIGNDEYQKKMILKLANEDWDAAAIAKELRISQNEVEFYLKTNA